MRKSGLTSANAILLQSANTLTELGCAIKIGTSVHVPKRAAILEIQQVIEPRESSAVKSLIVVLTSDLADVYQRISLAVDYQEKVVRHNIAYSRAETLIALSGNIWADVRRKISHHALKKGS